MESELCVICLDNNIEIGINFNNDGKCKHNCMCLKCYMILSNNDEKTIRCPLCRSETYLLNYTNLKDYTILSTKICHILYPNQSDKDFYKFLKSYFSILSSPFNFELIFNTIYDAYTAIYHKKKEYPLLSVEDSTKLLKIVDSIDFGKNSYRFKNFLVSVCISPWLIGNIGGCGICYFGNFGYIPPPKYAISIIKYNQKRILERPTHFFG